MYESTRSRSWTTSRIAVAAAVVALGVGTAATASASRNNKPQPPSNPDPKGQLVELQLLAFNDYHGHLEATTPGTWDGGRNSLAGGGSEYLSAKLSELRTGHKNSLTVAAGDLIGGSPFLSGVFHDEPSVESLNAMGLDVSSVGNHEFDEGVTELLRMQNGGCHPVDGCYFPNEPYAGADFQWLSANVVETATGETPLPPYWVTKVQSIDVAFIGMTLEATDTLVAPSGIVGYDFRDEVDTANELVPILQAKGIDSIVVLMHEGGLATGGVNGCTGISNPLAAIAANLDPEIDVIITGHTHAAYNCLRHDPSGNERIVTSAFSFGRVVTEINLVLDKRTGDVRRDMSHAFNHGVVQNQLTPDPALTAVIDKWKPMAEAEGSVVVGSTIDPIARAFVGTDEDRGSESGASNLIADAQLWATVLTADAQIAFMNPGGVRADFPAGTITFADAFDVQPFSNSLQTFPMTGEQILEVLKDQCQPSGSSRPFLHLGVSQGFTYDLSRTIENGNCTAISVTNVRLDGVALELGQSYLVTVNNFLADGGDNFAAFKLVDPSLRQGGGIDLDALVAYLGANSPVLDPGTDRVNELP